MRSDTGKVRITDRDAAGLDYTAHMYAMPYDLLARQMDVTPNRLKGLTLRWRRAGMAETAVLSAGPAWCWVTAHGLDRLGYAWTPQTPPLSRLAHIRAVAASRAWLQSTDAYRERGAVWRSERQLRAKTSAAGRPGHVPDGEIIWPASPDADGSVWAIEVELTPKADERAARIVSGLVSGPYERTVYLCSREAEPVIRRAAAKLAPERAARLSVRTLPPSALMPPAAVHGQETA